MASICLMFIGICIGGNFSLLQCHSNSHLSDCWDHPHWSPYQRKESYYLRKAEVIKEIANWEKRFCTLSLDNSYMVRRDNGVQRDVRFHLMLLWVAMGTFSCTSMVLSPDCLYFQDIIDDTEHTPYLHVRSGHPEEHPWFQRSLQLPKWHH